MYRLLPIVFLFGLLLTSCDPNRSAEEQYLINCLRINTFLLERDVDNSNRFFIYKLESNQSTYRDSIYRNRYAIQKNLLIHYQSIKFGDTNTAAIDSLFMANRKSHLLGIDFDFKIEKLPVNDSLSYYVLKNLYLQGIIQLQSQLIETLPNGPCKF